MSILMVNRVGRCCSCRKLLKASFLIHAQVQRRTFPTVESCIGHFCQQQKRPTNAKPRDGGDGAEDAGVQVACEMTMAAESVSHTKKSTLGLDRKAAAVVPSFFPSSPRSKMPLPRPSGASAAPAPRARPSAPKLEPRPSPEFEAANNRSVGRRSRPSIVAKNVSTPSRRKGVHRAAVARFILNRAPIPSRCHRWLTST